MNYLVVCEDGPVTARWFGTLAEAIGAASHSGRWMVYEFQLTSRKRPRLPPVDRKDLIEAAQANGIDKEKLATIRNRFKGKPGLPEGSQHITTDEAGELVIRPYQEA